MKGMSWRVESPKGSSNPKPLYWIVVSIGIVAILITFASWFFVSYPIGSTVHGYIYGVESSQISGYSVSQKIDITSVDLRMNTSFVLLDNKAPSKIEKNDTSLDSHVMNHICCF
ncbi:Protein yls7 [Trifolium repens]|nr:Protein yls7 [Trifolium repens]